MFLIINLLHVHQKPSKSVNLFFQKVQTLNINNFLFSSSICMKLGKISFLNAIKTFPPVSTLGEIRCSTVLFNCLGMVHISNEQVHKNIFLQDRN